MPKIQYDNQGMPIYRKEDGWKSQDEFQSAAIEDMKRWKKPELLAGRTENNPNAFYNAGGKYIPMALPAAGGVLGELAEPLGGGVAGAGLGSIISEALKRHSPESFGEPTSNFHAGVNVGTDMLMQGIAPLIAKQLLGGSSGEILSALKSKGITGKASDLISSALKSGRSELSTAKQSLIDLLRAGGLMETNQ